MGVKKRGLNIVRFVPELISWIQVFLSPFLIGVVLGACVYFYFTGIIGLIIGSVCVLFGIVLGLLFAEKVRKTRGTSRFMSKLISTQNEDELK